MTRLTGNDLSPRVRRFARFANAVYQTSTVEHLNRLLDYAQPRTEPGFGRFYGLADAMLKRYRLRLDPAPPSDRLPQLQAGDDTLLPLRVRDEALRALAWVADDAYRRDDVSAIARGSHATPYTVTKRGRTVYDQHGRPLLRVLLTGADDSVYAAILDHWVPPHELYAVPPEFPEHDDGPADDDLDPEHDTGADADDLVDDDDLVDADDIDPEDFL